MKSGLAVNSQMNQSAQKQNNNDDIDIGFTPSWTQPSTTRRPGAIGGGVGRKTASGNASSSSTMGSELCFEELDKVLGLSTSAPKLPVDPFASKPNSSLPTLGAGSNMDKEIGRGKVLGLSYGRPGPSPVNDIIIASSSDEEDNVSRRQNDYTAGFSVALPI